MHISQNLYYLLCDSFPLILPLRVANKWTDTYKAFWKN